jgi:hypothetical protein
MNDDLTLSDDDISTLSAEGLEPEDGDTDADDTDGTDGDADETDADTDTTDAG